MTKRYLGDDHLIQTATPFFPVSTDMTTGKEFVIRDIKMWEAMIASGAVPVLLPLVKHKDTFLGDGGMTNNVPASVLKQFGCDFVISINITVDPANNKLNPKSITSVLGQTIDIMMDQSVQKYVEFTDFELVPDVDEYGTAEFVKGGEILEIGKKLMEDRLDELKRTLQKMGIKPEPKKGG